MIDCAVLVAVIGYLVYLFSTETVSTNCRTGEMDHKKPILVRAYNDIQDRWWPKPSEPEVKDEPLNQQQCYSRQEEQTTA